MIKGVNKNIIEISETGHDCFERAILFVRPDSPRQDDDHMRRKAMRYLGEIKIRRWPFYRNRRLFQLVGWLTAAGMGAAVTALLLRVV